MAEPRSLVSSLAPSARPAKRRLRPQVVWGLASVLAFLLLWQLLVVLTPSSGTFFSTPVAVFRAGIQLIGQADTWNALGLSFYEVLAGFLLAVGLGIPLGLLLGRYPVLSALCDPLMMALYATPQMALIPLYVIWFGVGVASKIFVVFISALFPVWLNTATGMRQIDRVLITASRSFGASEGQLFFKVYLPNALPAILTGVRLAWGRGVLGMVIGEMYVSVAGLGHLIMATGQAVQTADLFFLIFLAGLLGYLPTYGLRRLEQRWLRWHQGADAHV
jgi:ABC-type nitrate/sulfonate/bicarbonate transport system permease component